MNRSPRLVAVLACIVLLTACGGESSGDNPSAVPTAVGGLADPHPCDLLSEADATGVLDVAIVTVDRIAADPSNGGQASCTWSAIDAAVALDVIVEGPAFFENNEAGYTDSNAAYEFWREDTLEAGFPVIDVEGAGDTAFMPALGPGPANTMIMRSGVYLVHLSVLGSGGEEQLTAAARLASAALDDR